jgi:hypothetical protein
MFPVIACASDQFVQARFQGVLMTRSAAVVLDQPQRLARTTRDGTSPQGRPIHALRLASKAQARSGSGGERT